MVDFIRFSCSLLFGQVHDVPGLTIEGSLSMKNKRLRGYSWVRFGFASLVIVMPSRFVGVQTNGNSGSKARMARGSFARNISSNSFLLCEKPVQTIRRLLERFTKVSRGKDVLRKS